MSDREQKAGAGGCAAFGLILVIALVLYVLSVGPAAWLAGHYPPLEDLKILYIPLLASGRLFRPWGDALEWYLDFWQ